MYTQTDAMKRALSHNGKAYPQGWCQKFVVVEVFATGGVGDFDHDGAADAEDGWKVAVAHGKVVKAADIKDMSSIPGGLPMYWTGGSHDNGHAATSLPAGKLFTTDKTPGVCGIVDNTWPHTHWGLTFAGYVLIDGLGNDLRDKPLTLPPVTPEDVVYEVTAAALNGRRGPGTEYAIVKSVLKGAKITSVGTSPAKDGSIWVKNTEGYYWTKSYLKVTVGAPKVIARTVGENVAGYNAATAPGVKGYKTHIPNIISTVININPDIFLTNELSNKMICPMRPMVDEGLKGHMIRSGGGTDGRYVYRANKGITRIASGNVVADKSTWYNGDDKQCAWLVYEKGGKRALDAVYQLAFQDGAVADKKRVAQALDFDTKIFAIAKQFNVPIANVLMIPDTNSNQMVIDALVKTRKRVNLAAGTKYEFTRTFPGWDGKSHSRLDYAVAGAGAKGLSFEVREAATAGKRDSDHDQIVVTRELV